MIFIKTWIKSNTTFFKDPLNTMNSITTTTFNISITITTKDIQYNGDNKPNAMSRLAGYKVGVLLPVTKELVYKQPSRG